MVIHIGEVQKPLHNSSIERCSLYFLVHDLEDLVELKGKDFIWMKEKYMLWIELPQSLEYKSKQICDSHIIKFLFQTMLKISFGISQHI